MASMAERLDGVPRKMLRVDSETHRKKVGTRVERALELAGISKQTAAHDMGYSDQGVVSRWCSGIERPQFDKLNTLDGFEDAYIVALAEKNPRVTLETVVRLKRRIA